jgi:hypothetical protein
MEILRAQSAWRRTQVMVLGREGLDQKDNYLILYPEGVWKGSKSRNIPEAPFSFAF